MDHLDVGGDQVERNLPVEPFLSTNLAAVHPPVGQILLARVVSKLPYQRPRTVTEVYESSDTIVTVGVIRYQDTPSLR